MGFLGGGGWIFWVLLGGDLVFEVSEVGGREGGKEGRRDGRGRRGLGRF